MPYILKSNISGSNGLFTAIFECLPATGDSSRSNIDFDSVPHHSKIPKGWSPLSFYSTIFLNTDQPKVKIYVESNVYFVLIQDKDIHKRAPFNLPPDSKSYRVTVTNALVKLFVEHDDIQVKTEFTKYCQDFGTPYKLALTRGSAKRSSSSEPNSILEYVTISVPSNFKLRKDEWLSIGLEPCSNLPLIPACYVADCSSKSFNQLSGNTWIFPKMPLEVLEAEGITGDLCCYENNQMLLSWIFFNNPKAILPYIPDLKHFAGKKVVANNYISFSILADPFASTTDVLSCPGILDKLDTVEVTPQISKVLNSRLVKIPENIPLASVPIPLRFIFDWNETDIGVFISRERADDLFICIEDADKTYVLPQNINRYILHIEVNFFSRVYRIFYLKSDLINLPRRDKALAKQEKENRRKRLESIHGSLPKNWNKFSDEDIAEHLRIKNMFHEREIQLAKYHVFTRSLPEEKRESFLHWIASQNISLKDPFTRRQYLPVSLTVDDLAAASGFIQMLKTLFGEWAIPLASSEKVRNAAVASLL